MIPADRYRITQLWLIWCGITLACFLVCGGVLNGISGTISNRSILARSPILITTLGWIGVAAIAWPMTALWVKWSREASTPFPGYGEPDSTHLCGYCDYDLAGLPEINRCPECGHSRNPALPSANTHP